MQSMVRPSKTIMSMVFDGLVLYTSMDFDGCSWISMVDHQIPCSPWSFMVIIWPGLLCRPGIVVGSGVLWTVKLPVKHHIKNANTDVISS